MEIGELKKLFDDMTIEEKAGQLFQTVGAMYDDEAVISGPMQETDSARHSHTSEVHMPFFLLLLCILLPVHNSMP